MPRIGETRNDAEFSVTSFEVTTLKNEAHTSCISE
jgi:hypothetical protein